MVNRSITLNVSDELYERVKQIAEVSQRTIEDILGDILLEGLDSLLESEAPVDISETALHALAAYSDTRLWAIACQRLTPKQSHRLAELSDKGNTVTLLPGEEIEWKQLVDLVDSHMLLRSEALVVLKQRGYDIEQFLKQLVR